MKNLILPFILILATTCKKPDNGPDMSTSIEAKYFLFDGQIGTNDNSTLLLANGDILICGNLNDNLSILRVSQSGNLVWRNDFFAGLGSSASGITIDSQQDIFVCGTTQRNLSESGRDILVSKCSLSGDTAWTKTYGGTQDDYGTCIISTSDGGILVAGKTESFGADTFGDLYLLKLDNSGDTIWTRRYFDSDQEVPYNLIESQNGGFLVTGTNEDDGNPREVYMLKVDSNGSEIWKKKVNSSLWSWGLSLIELEDGSFLACGKRVENGFSNILVLKTNGDGEVLWEKTYGNGDFTKEGYAIKANSDGTYCATGVTFDILSDDLKPLILKIDSDGNQLFYKYSNHPSEARGLNLIKIANDGNLITGNSDGKIFLAITDSNGQFK